MSYDAYGRPRHHRMADLTGDGSVGSADHTVLLHHWGAMSYADLNRDGTVDTNDQSMMLADWGAALPAGTLSTTDNILGYAGYIYDAELHIYLARHRWYDPELGRWLQRDPAGYVDGLNLYLYGLGSPFVFVDPMGLSSWWRNLCGGTRGLFFGSELGAWHDAHDGADATRFADQERLIAENKMTPAEAEAANAHVQAGRDAVAKAEMDLTQARLDALATGSVLVPGVGGAMALGIESVNAGIDFSQGEIGSGVLRLGGGAAGAGANRMLRGGRGTTNSNQLGEGFHYTSSRNADSIARSGLRPGREGVFATTNGNLSPLQAQIDLALPPNRGPVDAAFRIDLTQVRRLGIDVGSPQQVGRSFNMPGGGTEFLIHGRIPPNALERVR